jgi:dTDP-4-amino-4,6-dideoxygalactose transaminase
LTDTISHFRSLPKPDAWRVNRALRFPFVKPRMPSMKRVETLFGPAVDAGYFSNFGPVSIAFERDVEAFLPEGTCAVACANCTTGLSAALMALGVTGSVLVPAFTFQATLSAVRGAGLNFIVADVDPDHGMLTPEAVVDAVERRGCDAVILVRPFGIWFDISPVADICRDLGVPLVIDNAAGFGISDDIRASYDVPDAVQVFSLHATKPLGIGEGGVIQAPALLQGRLRAALNFGFAHGVGAGEISGLNGKMPELAAAVARAALEGFPQRLRQRQAVAAFYADAAQRAKLEPFCADPTHSPWQSFPVRLGPHVSAQAVVAHALEDGLQVRRYYAPLAGVPPLPLASALSRQMICLPVYDGDDADHADEIWAIFARALTR